MVIFANQPPYLDCIVTLCFLRPRFIPAIARADLREQCGKIFYCCKQLPLAELEALARTLLSVLLAFLAAGVARKHAFALQFRAQLGVELEQSAGDAQAHGTGLSIHASAIDGGDHAKVAAGFGYHKRLARRDALLFGDEILIEGAIVHLELARSGTQKDSSGRRLAASGSVKLCCFSHKVLILCYE